MEQGLALLSYIAIILLLGLLSTLVSRKLRISNVLVLVFVGMFLQFAVVNGDPLFDFSDVFLTSISILAMVMIVFDSTSRFRWRELDEVSWISIKLTSWFTLTNIVVLSFFATILIFGRFTMVNYLYSMIFSSVMIATDPTSLFAMMGDVKNRVINLLELESLINTPLTVLLPFVIFDLVNTLGTLDLVSSFLSQIVPFLQQIIVGVGTGVVIGIIIFKAMKNVYSDQLSPVAIITAALGAYILAENMSGSGVLSVATLGLFFGSIYVKQKSTLQEFSYMLSNSLEIMVFILIGLMISIPLTVAFFLKSIALFLVLVLCRATAVHFTLKNEKYTLKEQLFATLNMPKGIAMAVVVFSFSVFNVPEISNTLDYMLIILVYTLILSTIVTRMSKHFINVDISKEMEKDEKKLV